MVRAETSVRLYARVAESLDDRAWKRLFERLAEDQDKRKKRLEREYDSAAIGRLRENANIHA
jgi:rubrerythrin